MNSHAVRMMRNRWALGIVGALLLCVGVFIYDNVVVSAQATSTDKKGLTLSPIRTELDAEPGTSQDKTLSITNSNDRPITVHLSVEEFSVINPQYDYAFNTETELIKWVKFIPSTLDLAVGETKQATYRVGVPVNAEPGGRYLSMFATTDAGVSTDDVTSHQRVASLLYIAVAGDSTRAGALLSLSTPGLVSGPTNWTANLQNTGTIHYRSRYNAVTMPLIGDSEISRVEGDALILPGTVRSISDAVPLPQLPGIYKVIYTIGLGDTPAVVQTKYMLYMPPVAVIVTVFAAILTYALVSEYRHRKNRH